MKKEKKSFVSAGTKKLDVMPRGSVIKRKKQWKNED